MLSLIIVNCRTYKPDILSPLDTARSEQIGNRALLSIIWHLKLHPRNRVHVRLQFVSTIDILRQKKMRGKCKDRDITLGRKLLSLVGNEYGYKGKKIAEYMQKDPSLITRHLNEGKGKTVEEHSSDYCQAWEIWLNVNIQV